MRDRRTNLERRSLDRTGLTVLGHAQQHIDGRCTKQDRRAALSASVKVGSCEVQPLTRHWPSANNRGAAQIENAAIRRERIVAFVHHRELERHGIRRHNLEGRQEKRGS